MTNPYAELPKDAFWRTGVAERSPLNTSGLYSPRFPITEKDRVFTAGSCFAQHIGRAMRRQGYKVLDAEPLPPSVSDSLANRNGYRMYSARYGNIYTVQQMEQLIKEAFGEFSPSEPVWRRRNAFFDSQRPNVEPEGLHSEDDVLKHRDRHLETVRSLLKEATLFVFTLGLTESWSLRGAADVFPTAPGVVAGEYDPDRYEFRNFNFTDIYSSLQNLREKVLAVQPKMRFLLTVSPVPLTATMSGRHVQIATSYSKAVLRAACGQFSDEFDDVDYFPSYEIITSPINHGVYFEANKRSVTREGVAAAMGAFFEAHSLKRPTLAEKPEFNVQCEDILLEAFSKK